MNLHLIRPEWLWGILPAALFALALWRGNRQQGQWRSVIDPELLAHLLQGSDDGKHRRNLTPLLLLLWVIACVAAAGPSLRQIPQPVHTTEDALVIALDLSYSMKAADLSPSRIDRARQKLRDLLAQRKEGQTALIAYAGDAHVVTPLTDDNPTITNLLPALDPGIMPLPGSQPAQAVQQALQLLHSAGLQQGRILLLTDGIDPSDRKAIREALEDSPVSLSILGIGTRTGAPLPLPAGGFLKDENGAIVTPVLDEEELRRTAADTGGRYRRMQLDDSDIAALLAPDAIAQPGEIHALGRSTDTWEDQGYVLVLLLLPAVLLLFRRGWLVCLLPLAFLATPDSARAAGWDDLWLTPDQQGQKALQAEDYEAAEQLFENRDWAGTAAYRGGDYEKAADAFAGSDNADALYNRANALARQGKLQEALDAYDESLQRKPDMADAEANRELVEELLEQQKQQQQEQSEGDPGEDEQQQQSADDSGQQQGEQQEQDQSGQQQGQQQDSGGQPGEQSPDSQQQQDGQGQSGEQDQSQTGEQPQSGQQPGEEQQAGDEPGDAQREQNAGRADGGEQNPKQDEASGMASGDGEAADQEQERDQALEQWLRRVPDDPAGLLREKFRYQSRQRQLQGEQGDDEKYW